MAIFDSDDTREMARDSIRFQLTDRTRDKHIELVQAFGDNLVPYDSVTATISSMFQRVSVPPVFFIPFEDKQRLFSILDMENTFDSPERVKDLGTESATGGFYDPYSDAAFVFRNPDRFGSFEPFISLRIAAHELAHGIRPGLATVRFSDEPYRSGAWYTQIITDETGNKNAIASKPRVGFVTLKADQSVTGGLFLDDAVSEWVASRWVIERLKQGNYPDVAASTQSICSNIQVAEYDQRIVSAEIRNIGSYPVPASFVFYPDEANGKLMIAHQSLAGAALWMMAQKDPNIIPVTLGAKAGDLGMLRQFPQQVDSLLGRGGYAYLRGGGVDLQSFTDRYQFVKEKLGY